ncbi:MAG: guanylate kinase [Candidatus Omnitrophota bacterium]|nr:MAG: guanylate kinase [Candidatus Omnitrophota bacterium]
MAVIKGIPIVLSGPSGVGKGTVIQSLLESRPELLLSISMTTRSPRPNERDGVDYYFVNRARFDEAIERNELVEWAAVYHHYYGTPKQELQSNFERGRDVILDIDVQGAASVRNLYEDSVLVFLLPPSLEELKRRLYSRQKGTEDDLEHRIAEYKREIRFLGIYDYVIVNERVDQAVSDLYSIIAANRLLRKRGESMWRANHIPEP